MIDLHVALGAYAGLVIFGWLLLGEAGEQIAYWRGKCEEARQTVECVRARLKDVERGS